MNTKKGLIWAIIIIIAAGLIFLLYKYGGGESTNTGPLSSVPEVRASDKVLGKTDAKATIIEYADFQCPACAMYNPVLNQLQKENSDSVKIVYRYFPLISIHKNAMLSSQAAEAASLQGKFWEMHDALFQSQSTWAESGNAEQLIIELAGQLGLDKAKFQNDLHSDPVKKTVQDGLDESTNLGLNSTPTFFLNGQKLESNPRSLADFKQLIDAAAASAK